MSTTQLRLDTQAKDATLTPSKISVTATDDFSFPRDVSAGRDLRITDNNKLILGNSGNAYINFNTNLGTLDLSVSGASQQIFVQGDDSLRFNTHIEFGNFGTATNPAITASGNTAGILFPSGTSVAVAVAGTEVARFSTTFLDIFGALETEYDGAANDLSIYVGTSNQGFFQPAPHQLGIATNSVERVRVTDTDTQFIGVDVKLSNDKKLILGNSGNAFVKYDSGNDFILWQQDASGTTQFTSNGEFDLYSNTGPNFTGSFSPALEMYATGQMWLRNDGGQGSDGDRFVKIKFDDGFTAGFHGVERLSLSSDTDWLQLGYDADGSVRTGTRILGENLTVQSTNALNLMATRVNAVGADVVVEDGKKVILGNSDQAWFKYSTDVGGIVGKTNDSNNAFSFYFGAEGGLHLYGNVLSDGSGTYQPSLNIYDDGRVDLRNCDAPQGGATTNSRLAVQFDQGVTVVGFNPNMQLYRTASSAAFLKFGYDSDGSSVTGSRIQGTNLTIQSLSPLNFIADTHIFTGQINGDTSDQTKAAYRTGNVAGTGITGGVLGVNSIDFLHGGVGVASINGTDFDISAGSLGFYGSFFGIADSAATVGVGLFGDYSDFVGIAAGNNEVARFNTTGLTIASGLNLNLLGSRIDFSGNGSDGLVTFDGSGFHIGGINTTINFEGTGGGAIAANSGGNEIVLSGSGFPQDAIDFITSAWYVNFNDTTSEIQFSTAASAHIFKVTYGGLVLQNASTIDMGGNKITNLAAATANGDATRFEQTVVTDGSHPITGDQSFSSTAKITNLVDPLNAQDGATKAYVDAAIAGLSWKEAAQAASVANVTISSAPATLDGYTLVTNDRILLKDQTAPAENGVYQFNGTGNPLTRTTDADSWTEIVGMVIYIEEGTSNTGSKWVNTNVPGGTLGTTPITYTTFAAASAIDGVGTAGYNTYWTAAHTIAAEQYVAASRGGLATDASAFTGVVKASGGTFSASTIVNADVNASAAIAESKLALDFSTSSLNTAIGTKVSKAGDTMTGTLNIQHLIPTANGTYDLGQATPNRMRDIYLNGQVKGGGLRPNGGSTSLVALAAQGNDDTGLYFTGGTLHYSKAGVDQGELATLTTSLSPTLTSAHIFVGNASNVATDTAMSGDITITNTGVTSIGAFKVTPGKISNVATDDFTFPRNVTVTSQLNLNTGNKISFDNGGQVYLQSNAGDNILIGHSATTGVNVFSLGSFGQIDLITQAQGAGFPKLSMSPDGTRGSVLWTTSGAGSIGSRYIGVQFDDDVTNAFHSIERLARTSIASPYLEFGYDANGTSVTGSRIRGSNLTVESLSPLNLVATLVDVQGADVRIANTKKVIFGNSDNTFATWDNSLGYLRFQTVGTGGSSGTANIGSTNRFTIYPFNDGSGNYYFQLASSSVNLINDASAIPFNIRFLDTLTTGFNPIVRMGTTSNDNQIVFGYDDDGVSQTGTRIRGANLTIESANILNLATTRVNAVSADVALNDDKQLIFSTAGDAWMKYNSTDGIVIMTTNGSNPSALGFVGEFGIFANVTDVGGGSYVPAIFSETVFAGESRIHFETSTTTTGYDHPMFSFTNDTSGIKLDMQAIDNGITHTHIKLRTYGGGLMFGTQSVTEIMRIQNSGDVELTTRFLNADGSQGSPSYSFLSQPAAGFYYDSASGNTGVANDLNMAEGNSLSFGAIDETNFTLVYDTGSFRLKNNNVDVLIVDGTTNEANFTSHKIHGVADPTSPQDAATKVYVDNVAAGLDVKAAVRVATTANLSVTAAGSGVGKTLTATVNGAIVIDGVSLVLNDRVLVKNQTTASNNGIYTVTTVGTGGTPYVLTRATDFDGSPSNEVAGGDFTFVEEGTQSATGWTVVWNGNIVVDTNPINWTQFNASVTYMAGTGIKLTGNTFSITTDNSLTTSVSDPTLIVKRDGAGAIGLSGSGIAVNVDNASIEINSNALRVKAAGITYAMSNVVTRETPSGTVDGSNAVFTLAFSAAVGSEMVFLNGILQDVGGTNDYTISGDTITFTSAPLTGSKIRVTYWKA